MNSNLYAKPVALVIDFERSSLSANAKRVPLGPLCVGGERET